VGLTAVGTHEQENKVEKARQGRGEPGPLGKGEPKRTTRKKTQPVACKLISTQVFTT
jgi:hypothetical protein